MLNNAKLIFNLNYALIPAFYIFDIMKSRIPAKKARSPRAGDTGNHDDEIDDDLEDDRQHKQVPNTLVVSKKGTRLARADLSNTAAFFGRKARSNSPKEGAPARLNTNMRQPIYKKCHSPAAAGHNQVAETARPRQDEPDEPTPAANIAIKYGTLSKASHSPSPPHTATTRNRASPTLTQRTQASPRPATRFQAFEPEETKALKALARKKRQLNEDLWDAASNGDLVKLSRLLEPYLQRGLFSDRVRKGDLTADINSTGIENRTALHCAVYENKLEAAKLLLKFGAAPDARTVHHRTPLHIACILGEDQMCKLLLDSGATVSLQDFEKNTPVHYAAFYSKSARSRLPVENIKILKLLLERKPDLTIKNKKGQTPIDITNSKTIISLFWHYLTGNPDAGSAEEMKGGAAKGHPVPLPKGPPIKKVAAKLVLAGGRAKKMHDGKPKDYTGSENLTSAVLCVRIITRPLGLQREQQ